MTVLTTEQEVLDIPVRPPYLDSRHRPDIRVVLETIDAWDLLTWDYLPNGELCLVFRNGINLPRRMSELRQAMPSVIVTCIRSSGHASVYLTTPYEWALIPPPEEGRIVGPDYELIIGIPDDLLEPEPEPDPDPCDIGYHEWEPVLHGDREVDDYCLHCGQLASREDDHAT